MNITSTTEFGEAIRNKRKAFGYTQGYISEVTGLSVSFISDLERGKTTAELGKSIQIANLLGIDICLNERK